VLQKSGDTVKKILELYICAGIIGPISNRYRDQRRRPTIEPF